MTIEPSAPTLAGLQNGAYRAIDRRLSFLGKLEQRVQADHRLTDADRTALEAQISSAHDGLAALRQQISSDTDVSSVKTDASEITKDYRVYMELAPKVIDTERADSQLARVAALQHRLASMASGSVPAEVTAQLDAAAAAAQAAHDAVAGLTPGDFPTGAATTAGAAAKATAKSDLATGRGDLGSVENWLDQQHTSGA